MDHIEAQQEFYKDYIPINFDSYVEFKRKSGAWGDDIEIQAISELYKRPVRIYAYSAEPLRRFSDNERAEVEPIQISYHN